MLVEFFVFGTDLSAAMWRRLRRTLVRLGRLMSKGMHHLMIYKWIKFGTEICVKLNEAID